MICEVQIRGCTRRLKLTREDGIWLVLCDGKPLVLEAAYANADTVSLLLEGRSFSFGWARGTDGTVWIAGAGRGVATELRDPRRARAGRQFELAGRARLKAPMAGKVVKLLAAPGEAVESGQGLMVLEAMKMQNEVRSPKSGRLAVLAVAAGDTVASGQVLAEVE